MKKMNEMWEWKKQKYNLVMLTTENKYHLILYKMKMKKS